MYNMNISLFGYKMNVMTLLFFVIVMILLSHTICGCRNPYGLIEGAETMTEAEKKDAIAKAAKEKEKKAADPTGIMGLVQKAANTESFSGMMPYSMVDEKPVNTSMWGQPDLTIRPGQPVSPAVKAFLDRPEQPVPLPADEMLMFANTPFKPECCPNTYSNSSGCACMTGKQYNWLIHRAGNNVPYSEY